MGNQNDTGTLKKDVEYLKCQVKSLQEERHEHGQRQVRRREQEKKNIEALKDRVKTLEHVQEKQKLLEKERLQAEKSKERQRELELEKAKVEAAHQKSVLEEIKYIKENYPEENLTTILHYIYIDPHHSFVSQDKEEDNQSCYAVMTGEENISESLINDTHSSLLTM